MLALSWTPLAKAQFTEIRRRAEANSTGFDGVIWNILKGTINKGLRRPDVAFHTGNDLGIRKHDFTGVRRAKINNATRGVRIFYLASRPLHALTLLMLGERLVRQPDDVYEVLAAHIAAGDFDTAFAEFSVPKPVIALPSPGLLLTPAANPWAPTSVANGK